MNFSRKEGHPNIQPSTRPGIETGTSGLGGRDVNHCTNLSAFLYLLSVCLKYISFSLCAPPKRKIPFLGFKHRQTRQTNDKNGNGKLVTQQPSSLTSRPSCKLIKKKFKIEFSITIK